jgi:hypothetical protein
MRSLIRNATSDEESGLFDAFLVPLQPLPARIEAAIAGSVRTDLEIPFSMARLLLTDSGDGVDDGIVRNTDGTLTVAFHSAHPGTWPEMWDWWCAFFLQSTARFMLAHPKAHVRSARAFNRSHITNARARYVENIAFVDEYIGPGPIRELAIAFEPPTSFGLDQATVDRLGTAICARVIDRARNAEVARFVHVVRRAEGESCHVRSRIWLGDVRILTPVVGALLGRLANRPAARRRNLPDAVGRAVLRHCAEETIHLGSILRGLFARYG